MKLGELKYVKVKVEGKIAFVYYGSAKCHECIK
ncbi:Uncharacterised protein [Fusobacterium necrophorum subsp. necrophorum]|nr:Uncharacterised protein [Fusobacterium necrophorum subsp. necrophorum]